jgi:hypothetical protein
LGALFFGYGTPRGYQALDRRLSNICAPKLTHRGRVVRELLLPINLSAEAYTDNCVKAENCVQLINYERWQD